jgi:Transposase
MLAPHVRVVRCAAKTHPCPTCGKRGRRQRTLHRRIRSLAYRQEAFLDVHYAEYKARCSCRKSFRSWPIDVPAKADYDELVRTAVLDRLLEDGLNVERTRASMKRDFLLELSSGFVYDCLDWQLARLNLGERRQRTLENFSGTLCVDELHLGRHTLLLATDPLSDEVVGFALVSVNDSAHLRRFLLTLKYWGFLPRVVISDGSNLYPGLLAEVWPNAAHQLCVFHVLQDVTDKVLDAVRRLRRACERRGKGGRKRKPGRPKKGAKKRRAGTGPTAKQKAAFVFKRRHLIVKRAEKLSEQERADLEVMFGYQAELKTLWQFSQEIYKVWQTEQSRQVARWRWTRLKNDEAYQGVPELAEVLEWLDGEKLDKTQAFCGQPLGQRQKTNNHVERMNRKLRFDEKARYKWRKRKSIVRFVLLRISRHVPRPKTHDQPPPKGGG